MNRRTALTVALAALALVAVAFAAATLDSATTSAGGGLGFGSAENPGAGDGDSGPVGDDTEGNLGIDGPAISLCVPFLTRPLVQFALVALVALLAYGLYRRTESVAVPAVAVAAFGLPGLLVYVLLTSCRPPGEVEIAPPLPSQEGNQSILPSGGGQTGVGDAAGQVSTPTLALGALLVVALAGSVFLLLASTGDDEEVTPDPEPESDPDTDIAAVGRAAGAAADRIEDDADVTNEVYRAWREMTDHVAVARPQSSTPGEFADAAVDAGMAPDDVRELTALFEDVRYGGEAATADRERRAVAALRRIESAYADADGEGADDGGNRAGDDGLGGVDGSNGGNGGDGGDAGDAHRGDGDR